MANLCGISTATERHYVIGYFGYREEASLAETWLMLSCNLITLPSSVVMKTPQSLLVVGLITALSFISAGYCFWLMTVPLSYDWVPVVLIGFLVSLLVFPIAAITALVLYIRLRRSRRASANSPITPAV